MDRAFYEFLFDLRASDFSHHTPESAKRILFESVGVSHHNASDFLSRIDGEVGSFSDEALSDARKMIIGINFAMALTAIERHVDCEYAHTTADYFINKVDQISTFNKFEALLEEMSLSWQNILLSKQRQSYGKRIDKCIHYLEQHLYSSIRVNTVASYIGMTPAYLTRLFKERTGQTLYRYFLLMKIDEAKDILKNTDQPLTNISAGLGFHSLSHFSKAFKSATGVAPSVYREQPN